MVDSITRIPIPIILTARLPGAGVPTKHLASPPLEGEAARFLAKGNGTPPFGMNVGGFESKSGRWLT